MPRIENLAGWGRHPHLPPGQCKPLTAGWFSSQTREKVLSTGASGYWCAQSHDHLLCISSLQTVWRMGMPPPAFTETVWVLNCWIPYLIGASLCLLYEKLLHSEEDHRLGLYRLSFTRCARDVCVNSPRCPCWGAALSEYPGTGNQSRKGAAGCQGFMRKFLLLPMHGGLTHSLSQMALRLSVTMIKLSLIPAGEA